jgi:hypothetical protein
MAAATMVDPPRTEVALRLLENLLGILLAGDLDAQDAAWAADTLAAQVTYGAIEAELRRTDPRALAAEITANFARLPADEFPLITAHTAQLDILHAVHDAPSSMATRAYSASIRSPALVGDGHAPL